MKLKSLMRFVCIVIASVMMSTLTVSAYDGSNDEITTSTVSEFADSVNEVAFLTETQSVSNQVYGPGRWYMGTFTFHDYNNGYYHTYKGSRMRICIAYRQEDSDNYSADLYVGCYGYSDGFKIEKWLCAGQDEPDENGYRYYVLDWFPILSGGDYRLEYQAYTCGAGDIPRTVSCHVWIDVE